MVDFRPDTKKLDEDSLLMHASGRPGKLQSRAACLRSLRRERAGYFCRGLRAGGFRGSFWDTSRRPFTAVFSRFASVLAEWTM